MYGGTIAIKKNLNTQKTILYVLIYNSGEFDPPSLNPYTAINMSVVQSPEHRHLAVTAAQMSFTLLKNHENALPLKSKVHKLAVSVIWYFGFKQCSC